MLSIAKYPNPLLKKKCSIVDISLLDIDRVMVGSVITDKADVISAIFNFTSRYLKKEKNALGLSANQVYIPNSHYMKTSHSEEDFLAYRPRMFSYRDMWNSEKIHTCINPEIIKFHSENKMFKEGCLSFPGLYRNVKRSDKITVQYYDLDTREIIRKDIDGVESVVFQHELDHLNGIVFTDRMGIMGSQAISKYLKSRK